MAYMMHMLISDYLFVGLMLNVPVNSNGHVRRMAIEIISRLISTKLCNWAGIKLMTPGSAVRHEFAVRHVTDCATSSANISDYNHKESIYILN